MKQKVKPPSGLGKAGRELYVSLMSEFALDDSAGRALLLNAAEATDRIQQAREVIAREGLFLTDRLGKRYTHPAAAIETSSSKQLLAALRGLRLAPNGNDE